LNALSHHSIRAVALRFLANRDYSQHEMAKKLKSKGYSYDEIALLLAELTQNKLLDDRRFAENYIYKRRTKGYGPHRIRIELQMHGLSDELIAETLKITDNAWFIDIKRVWQKHFKGKQASDFKNRAKQMRFLHYRGFTAEQVESVFHD